eukprot:5310854-Amphidinium_carterae.1
MIIVVCRAFYSLLNVYYRTPHPYFWAESSACTVDALREYSESWSFVPERAAALYLKSPPAGSLHSNASETNSLRKTFRVMVQRTAKYEG